MKNFQKNWYIFVYIFIYALKWLGLISTVSPKVDLFFVFLLVYYFLVRPIMDSYKESRLSTLILVETLRKKGVFTSEDLYLTQNKMVGNTPASDVDDLRKTMARNGLFLEDYKTDEEVSEVREKNGSLDFSIFEYFRDLQNNSSESFISDKKIK
jgi:hypothetical protein